MFSDYSSCHSFVVFFLYHMWASAVFIGCWYIVWNSHIPSISLPVLHEKLRSNILEITYSIFLILTMIPKSVLNPIWIPWLPQLHYLFTCYVTRISSDLVYFYTIGDNELVLSLIFWHFSLWFLEYLIPVQLLQKIVAYFYIWFLF